MRRGPRGGPGEFGLRRERAVRLLDQAGGATRGPLSVLVAVLRHQQARAGEATPAAPGRRSEDGNGGAGRFPLLDLDAAAAAVEAEVGVAVATLTGCVPLPLRDAGDHLVGLEPSALAAVVEAWLDDVAVVEPRLGFWLGIAAAPVIEPAAREAAVPDGWAGTACAVCGGPPAVSVIAEESGEFMAGSPRSLVCGRCAAWWPFRRAACVDCGEEDPARLESFLDEARPWARVDTCARCRSYVKTFDLRAPGAVDVIPLVDDVGTLTLDVWVRQRGFSRPAWSMAGV